MDSNLVKKYIYFRVDGDNGKYSGLGHIWRSLLLYNKLRINLKKYKFVFLCRYSEGIKIIKKKTTAKVLKYNLKNIKKIHLGTDDVFIIDTLGAEKNLLKLLNKAKLKKISFDETNLKYFQNGLIINGIFFAKKKIKKIKKINVYQGPKYIILDNEYKKQYKKRKNYQNNFSALVCSGGGDYKNFLYKTSSNLINSKLDKIYTVIGSAVKKNNKIHKLKSNKIKQLHNLNSLRSAISKSDIIICSGGTIMFEAIAMHKKPYIFLNYYNQKYAINYFDKKKAIINCKKPKLKNIIKMKKNIDNLILKNNFKNIYNKTNLVDGKGLERSVRIILDYINKK